MNSITDTIVTAAERIKDRWSLNAIKAWVDVPPEEREILKKYVSIFLKKLKDEDFPEDDKKILRRHAKQFLDFLKKVDG